MNVIELIDKKANQKELNDQEIKFIVKNFVSGKIKDYQMSSFLMAVKINGMSIKETALLTKHMMYSGKIIDLSKIRGIKVDKHSTGGIGDKTTIAVGPIVSSCGAIFSKMSGRGLGFTGGTLDKLESIPGYKVEFSEKEFINQVNKIKIAVIGQTKQVVPADKKMYSLRDVTGTTSSIPLIVSSIMSKKLATGSDSILLDVKFGNGAFMKTKEEAQNLSNSLIDVGKFLNKNVESIISNMNEPLGKAIGNKNEIIEAINTLKGKGPKDFQDLVYKISSKMLIQAKIASNKNEAMKMILESIKNNKALKKFKEWIKAQGGDVDFALSKNFWSPKYKLEIFSNKDGVMKIVSAIIIGNIAAKLGAGRFTKEDLIDNEAGILINKKSGEKIKKGDLLFTLYSSNKINANLSLEIKSAFIVK